MDSVYLSLLNAVLLVRAVIIKLTRRREGGIGVEKMGEGGFEGICLSLY
jgi:hypothetical protein